MPQIAEKMMARFAAEDKSMEARMNREDGCVNCLLPDFIKKACMQKPSMPENPRSRETKMPA